MKKTPPPRRPGRPRTNPLPRAEQLRIAKRAPRARDEQAGFVHCQIKVRGPLAEKLQAAAGLRGLRSGQGAAGPLPPRNPGASLHELGFETREGGVEALHDIARVVLEAAVRLRQQTWMDRDVAREAGEDLPRMIRENPIVRVPSHVVLLGRVIALLSGLGRSLEARVDMLQTILPYVLKSAAATAAAPRPEDAPAAG